MYRHPRRITDSHLTRHFTDCIFSHLVICLRTFSSWEIQLLRSAFFLDFRQRRMVIYYRRFGTTCQSHLQRSSSVLEMGTVGCPATSLRNYHYRPCQNPIDRNSHVHPRRKSGIKQFRNVLHWLSIQFVVSRMSRLPSNMATIRNDDVTNN